MSSATKARVIFGLAPKFADGPPMTYVVQRQNRFYVVAPGETNAVSQQPDERPTLTHPRHTRTLGRGAPHAFGRLPCDGVWSTATRRPAQMVRCGQALQLVSTVGTRKGMRRGDSLVDVQRTGRIFGWLFIGTFVTSIPARLLFIHGLGASWTDIRFVPGDTSTASLKLGAVLEFGLIVTQIGTAVVIYSLVRRQSETLSLGYVSARIMESVFAAIGIISIISVVNVADSLAAGGDAAALGVTGNSLASTYQWAFQWGPGLVAGIGNGLILGYLMYRSELVPRRMAMLGLIGGPVLILSHVLILGGAYKNGEGPSGLLTLPEAAWELSLGIYTAWKGFRPESPIARAATATAD
jgi:uncharacterized protein DUF4386